MAALLDTLGFLIPVIGMLAAFAAVMASVFLLVPRLIEWVSIPGLAARPSRFLDR